MSAVHALNGYREAQIINKRKELRRKAVHSLVSTVKMALAKQVPADWFRDPFFWELYDAQRNGSESISCLKNGAGNCPVFFCRRRAKKRGTAVSSPVPIGLILFR